MGLLGNVLLHNLIPFPYFTLLISFNVHFLVQKIYNGQIWMCMKSPEVPMRLTYSCTPSTPTWPCQQWRCQSDSPYMHTVRGINVQPDVIDPDTVLRAHTHTHTLTPWHKHYTAHKGPPIHFQCRYPSGSCYRWSCSLE